jgi:hypothetical protein
MSRSLTGAAAVASIMMCCAPAAAQPANLFRAEGIEFELPQGFRTPALGPSGSGQAKMYLAYTQDGQGQIQFRVQDVDSSEATSLPARRSLLAHTVRHFANGLAPALPGGRVVRMDTVGAETAEYLTGSVEYAMTLQSGPQRARMQLYIPRTGLVRLVGLTIRLPGENDPASRDDIARAFTSMRIPPPTGPARVRPVTGEGISLTLPAGFGGFRRREGREPERFYYASNGEIVVLVMLADPPERRRQGDIAARGSYLQSQARMIGRATSGPGDAEFLTAEVEMRQGEGRLARGYVPRTGPMRYIQVIVMRTGDAPVAGDPELVRILDSLKPGEAAAPEPIAGAEPASSAAPAGQGDTTLALGPGGLRITLPSTFRSFRSDETSQTARMYRATDGDVVVMVVVVDALAEAMRDLDLEGRRRMMRQFATSMPGGSPLPTTDTPTHLVAGSTFDRLPDYDAADMRGVTRIYIPRTGPLQMTLVSVMRHRDRPNTAGEPQWTRVLDSIIPANGK